MEEESRGYEQTPTDLGSFDIRLLWKLGTGHDAF